MQSAAITCTVRLTDRFGNTVAISVRSALPEREAITREIEASAAKLMDVVRQPESTTRITQNT